MGGPLADPHDERGSIIPSYCGERILPEKFKNPVPVVKTHTGLDDGMEVEDEPNTPVKHRKCIFWQTSVSDQRPKLRMYINGNLIKGLLDTDVNIVSLPPNLGIQIGLFKR